MEDVHFHKDRVTLHLKASKTDPFPKGVDIHLFSSGASVCPVISLEDMLNLEIKHLKGIMIKNHSCVMEDGKALMRNYFIYSLKRIPKSFRIQFLLV